MAEPMIIKLEDSITNEKDETITEISLRPPNLGDRQFLDKCMKIDAGRGDVIVEEWATVAWLAAQRLGNLAPATATKIGGVDAQKIFNAVLVFIGGSQKNGQTQPPSLPEPFTGDQTQ